jgi:hypothetical protein
MSERSIYLRDQAQKCMRHAAALSDDYTQRKLRDLACQYTVQAGEIESKEAQACSLSPTLRGLAPPIPDAEPKPI